MEPMKIEKINSLFNCGFCRELFQTPVLLPCGEIICRKDLSSLVLPYDSSLISCCFCYKDHVRPVDDFPVVKRMVDLIELGNDKINFGKTYEYGVSLLKEFDRTIKELETIGKDPYYFVYNNLHEIKNQCDLRRENLKMDIDNYFDNILSEIDKYKAECESFSRTKSESISAKLNSYKSDLNDWKKSYDTVNLQEEVRDQVILKAKLAKLKLDLELNALKQNLLQNKMLKFEADKFIDPRIYGVLKIEEELKEKNTDHVLFKYKLKNFANFKFYNQSDAYSLKYSTGDLKWLIYVKHKYDGYLDCHLLCDNLRNRAVDADFQIDLINSNDPGKKYSKTTTHKFRTESSNWGWNKFIKIDDLISGGFYNEQTDSIMLEVLVSIKKIES